MQTWLVHMRQPYRLFRELGPGGFLAFQLIVGGNALVALVHPVLMLRMISEFLQPDFRETSSVLELVLCLLIVVAGYLLSAAIGFLGLAQRGLLKQAGVLALTPLHWLLLSIAAWWAALELVYAPFSWRKTEHGLDKASRQKGNHALAARTRASSRRFEAARRTRPDPGLEIAFQVGGGFLGPPLEAERRNKAALLVHQINQGRVIHAVLAVVSRNFLGVDAIRFLHRVD